MNGRQRVIACSMAILGVAVLLVTVLVFGGAVLEEWYYCDLATYDEPRSREAADWFGRHGGRRAMRRLFDLARELAGRPDIEDVSSGACNSMVRIGQALERIATERRRDVVPLLVLLLAEAPPNTKQQNQVRIGAAGCLEKMGPDAHEAIPALREALKDGDMRFRECIARAMEKIQGP